MPPEFSCQECGQCFTRRHNLKSHILIHVVEKPYKCPQCPANFRRQHDLKRHRRLHTGEKPFYCEVCKRQFARRDALVRHLNSKSGCGGVLGRASGDSSGKCSREKSCNGNCRNCSENNHSDIGSNNKEAHNSAVYSSGNSSVDEARTADWTEMITQLTERVNQLEEICSAQQRRIEQLESNNNIT